jgi:hypothetical protein
MKRTVLVACALMASGCLAKGSLRLGAGESQASAPQSGSSGDGGSSVDDVIDKAVTQPAKDFDQDAFYTISTVVDGKEYALTFVLPQGDDVYRDTITTSPSKAKVVLEKLGKEPTQLWQFHEGGISDKHAYLIYTKVSPQDEPIGIMIVYNHERNNRFVPTDEYRETYNRVTVSYNSNETNTYWQVVKNADGTFRLSNLKGTKSEINQPGEKPWPGKWNEERSLEVLSEGGPPKLTHGLKGETPAQKWKITKVGY